MKLTDKQALQRKGSNSCNPSAKKRPSRSRHARGRTRKAPPMAPEAHPAQNGSKSCSHSPPSCTRPTSLAAAAAPGQTSLAAAAAPGQTSPAAAAAPGQTSSAAAAAPDDFDTDEECRNPEIIADKWNWTRASPLLYTLIQRTPVGYLVRQHHRPRLLYCPSRCACP